MNWIALDVKTDGIVHWIWSLSVNTVAHIFAPQNTVFTTKCCFSNWFLHTYWGFPLVYAVLTLVLWPRYYSNSRNVSTLRDLSHTFTTHIFITFNSLYLNIVRTFFYAVKIKTWQKMNIYEGKVACYHR